MMTHNKLLLLIGVLLLCSSFARTQEKTSTETTQKPDADTAVREKAFELLESLATQIGTLQSPENRARLGSNIAASLWPHDEKRARALFIAVEEDIKLGLNRDAREDVDDHTFLVFLQLRNDTIERISKYDAELAFDFLTSTKPNLEDPPAEFIAREHALELTLAKQIVAANPDLALKLGRQSLAQGFSDGLLELLRNMHRKHREQAVTLYTETVRKLKKADLLKDQKALEFALSLALYPIPPVADDVAYRELINSLMTAAFANNCDKAVTRNTEQWQFCRQFGSVIEQMAQVDAVRAERLETFGTPVILDLPTAVEFEIEDAVKNGRLDELPALVQKYPDYRNQIYVRTAVLTYGSGDIEGAKKLASNIDDPDLRQSLLDQVQRDDSLASVSDQELAEYQKAIEHISRSYDRVDYLIAEVERIGGRNQAVAAKLLDHAYRLLDSIKPASEQTRSRLRLAVLFCAEKNDRGLGMMESLMPKLNELVDAAAKLDGFDTHYLRADEWNMSAEGDLGELLTFLADNAMFFAWCDFDRSVGLAAQFDRAEIRMMAQMKLAQGIVGGRPKRYPMKLDLFY